MKRKCGFPKTVREAALVASARRCCVCQRFKGVKVEVHHIEPEGEGGPNTYENAIPLCFDCHSEAGHFNPKHPRGTRYSREELRKHRARWYKIVKEKGIPLPEAKRDTLLARHLVCSSLTIAREIINGDFRGLPIKNSLLAKNEVLQEFRRISDLYGTGFQTSIHTVQIIEDPQDYFKQHPHDSVRQEATSDVFPSFKTMRVPTAEEARRLLRTADPLLFSLLEQGVDPLELGIVLGYQTGECGGSGFFEEVLHVRTISLALLAVENASKSPIRIKGLRARCERPPGLGFRPLVPIATNQVDLPLPLAPIRPRSTVLIPEAIILEPFEGIQQETWSVVSTETAPSNEMSHIELSERSLGQYRCVGPRIEIDSIIVETHDLPELAQPVHSLDLTNTYILTPGLQAGSCPHAFALPDDHSHPLYLGELFSASNGKTDMVNTVIQMPPGVRVLRIAELEDEVSLIQSAQANGEDVLRGARALRRDECLDIQVPARAKIMLRGWYSSAHRDRSPWAIRRRNDAIAAYLWTLSSRRIQLRWVSKLPPVETSYPTSSSTRPGSTSTESGCSRGDVGS